MSLILGTPVFTQTIKKQNKFVGHNILLGLSVKELKRLDELVFLEVMVALSIVAKL